MKVEKNQERSKYVGVGNCKVLAFNPTQEALCEIMGWEPKEDDKEIEYVKYDVPFKYKKGEDEIETTVTQLRISVVLQEMKTNTKHLLNFTIFDFYRTNKDGSKMQFINQHGGTCWVDDEANIPSWFSTIKSRDGEAKRIYRRARVGEDNFLEFLSKWTDINKFKASNNLFVENEKLFWTGDMKEPNSLKDVFGDNTIMCVFGIKSKEVEDDNGNEETKEFQTISNRFFCQGRFMRLFRNLKISEFEGVDRDKSLYDLNKFLKDVMDTENGFKEYFILDEIQPYDASLNPVNSATAIVDEDTSY